jgi:hypothetical protein
MIVEVRPIERDTWHGKVGKDSIQRPIKITALVDRLTMKYATGLSYVGKYDHPDNAKGLTEAGFYSKVLNRDLSNHFDRETPHPFWDSAMGTIKLDNKPMFLYTNEPLDYVKWKVLKDSKYVANSIKDYHEGKFPQATHVIYDEKEAIEEKASKIAIKRDLITKVLEMSSESKVLLATVLTGRSCRKQSTNYIEVLLDEKIEKNPREVAKFINMDKQDFSNYALVLESLHLNILRKKGHQIFYQDSIIGNEVMDIVDYLKKEENQDLKIRLLAAVT